MKRRKAARAKRDLGAMLEQMDSELIWVTEGGKRKRLPKIEVEFKKRFANALKGDLKAVALILRTARQYGLRDPNVAHLVRFKKAN
ncbi:DUF5681 domain-containing protein [uncultured Bradyrhizobium sp.]|jgi:hypothetical protein|uniref:DUF5681 domain-containing protein n=1 Tax=uncultured Bradyrhizobium sp. TaxID=199684 RepID=UPI00260B5316|nr:DUF5681 domain-containing protein [uncultured Bradyrhizobium sp.]